MYTHEHTFQTHMECRALADATHSKAKSLCDSDTDSVSGKELPPVTLLQTHNTEMSLRKGSTLHPNLAACWIAIPKKESSRSSRNQSIFLKISQILANWSRSLGLLDVAVLPQYKFFFTYFVISQSRMTATCNTTVATDMSDFDFSIFSSNSNNVTDAWRICQTSVCWPVSSNGMQEGLLVNIGINDAVHHALGVLVIAVALGYVPALSALTVLKDLAKMDLAQMDDSGLDEDERSRLLRIFWL